MNESFIKNVVEAAMLAAGRPLQVAELAELFDELTRPPVAAIRAALASLEEDYAGRGIEVKETATGFRIQVRRDVANEISRLWPERPPKYTRALLETLALIAYRQPITRAEIEAVRGVAVNPNIIKTLLERNWVRVVGTRDVPGRPELLGTTKDFLDYFGLRSLEELPPLAELKAMGDVNLQLDLAKPAEAVALAASGEGDAASATAESAATADVSTQVISETGEQEASAVAATASTVEDEASVDAMLEAAEASGDEMSAETSAAAASDADTNGGTEDEDEGDASRGEQDTQGADEAEAREAGPKRRAAEDFIAQMESEDDAEASAGEEDAGDDDELSADSQGSGELVAGPRDLDD